ncbi:MAG: hypothetical protein DRN20_04260 [Thermoplasmata archaeon]|nr:MAG: hypothetical protein DRN20_04260 [Thermoplasmata archaeon]
MAKNMISKYLDKIKGDKKAKKIISLVIALLLILTLVWGVLHLRIGAARPVYETGVLSLDELLQITSEMKDPEHPIVASDSDPFYAIMATPIALHYNEGVQHVAPLLVFQGKHDRYTNTGPSSAVNRFFIQYNETKAIIVGDVDTASLHPIAAKKFEGSPQNVSLELATEYWNRTTGALIVDYSDEGYQQAVVAAPLASYLSIPIVVADEMNDHVAGYLEKLGVRYTIVCGDIEGYGKAMHFSNINEINDVVISVVRERLHSNITYIAVANPLDTYVKQVTDSVEYEYSGYIHDSSAKPYPGAAPMGEDGPTFNFSVPYKYANVKIDVKMDVREAGTRFWWGIPAREIEDNADGSGERIYAFVGKDLNDDGKLEVSEDSKELMFFGGSPSYEYIRENPSDPTSKPIWAHFYVELPMFNEEVERHVILLLAKLPTDKDGSAFFTLKITVENLTSPTYPLMPGLSTMAPYLAAYHRGVVLARPEYQLHDTGYIGCASCGDPASNKNATEIANEQTLVVKEDINRLLAKLAGLRYKSIKGPKDDAIKLAEHYASLPMEQAVYLGIIADTNMVPMYYYPSSGQGDPTEGFGIPSDIIYQDIDADPEDPPYELDGSDPYLELPAGRVDGWDAQDVSALIARTVFYGKIIENYRGPNNRDGSTQDYYWKNSGMVSIGTEPPVGAALTAADKIRMAMAKAGMKVDGRAKNELARRQYSEDIYASSNFIFFCAHGFYYWYVPTAQEGAIGITVPSYGGGAYDVVHVKDMTLGPSVLWASSCVTGRIDGLPGRNCISQAFLHAGLNAYIGATRSAWGVIVPIPDAASGEKLGDLMALHVFAALTGYIYDKSANGTGAVKPYDISNATIGYALMHAKNRYIEIEGGADDGGTICDTFEEFILHGDPAFNPYEPNHEGAS